MFVTLSLVVAALGSWTALDLSRRASAHVGRGRLVWISTAAISMGLSIWSMHFIAMLSFDPGSPVAYAPGLTALSLVLAIVSTWGAFFAATRERLGAGGVYPAGAAMGAGIALMHYIGMAALRSRQSLSYQPVFVVASLIIAVVAATTALLVARRSPGGRFQASAALLLGAAVVGMHFTAMAGLRLTPRADAADFAPMGAQPFTIGVGIAAGTLLILFLALMASLYDQRGNILSALDAGGVGYWELDLQTRALRVSAQGKALFGLRPHEDMPLDRWLAALSPEDRARRDAALESALRTKADYDVEYRLASAGRWVNVRGKVLRDGQGRPARMMGVVLDVTDRHEAFAAVTANEHRLRLLTHELNHRVKNTLATIQSIAAHTARRAETLSEFRRVFEDRLLALSATHNILTQTQWEAASLTDIVSQEFSAYPQTQIATQGESLELSARQALALGLILHELTTNAAKYGALSTPEGRITLDWRRDWKDGAAWLRLSWRETGGPSVVAPSQFGFGSRLIKTSVEHDLHGEVALTYSVDGVQCLIVAPLPDVRTQPSLDPNARSTA